MMILLCKKTLFLLIIFVFYSMWIQVINALMDEKSMLKLFFQVVYLILTIFITYLSIKCGYWIIFEYWRWGL